MKKSRIQFLYALLAFLAAEGLQIIIVYIYQMIYSFMIGFKIGMERASDGKVNPSSLMEALKEPMSPDMRYMISVVAVLFCGIAFFFWYRYEIRGEGRGSIRRTFSVKNIILFLLLGIGCQFFISGVMSIMKQYFVKLFENYTDQMVSLTSGNVFVVLLLLILVAPVTEELIFRGIILHKASRAIPFWGANLLQAMLFGVYHWNIIQGIYAALIGFVLGLVYRKYKTLLASMLLHSIINTSSFLLYLIPDNEQFYYIVMSAGAVVMCGALIVMLRSRGYNS